MKIIRFIFKIFSTLLTIAVILIIGYLLAVKLGFIPEQVPISGTGSMYPTFPKGEGTESASLSRQIVATPAMKRFPRGITIGNFQLFPYSLQRNDIVSFENDITRKVTLDNNGTSTGFVKRVIALPGETIEIRDGFVLINDQKLIENFTAVPRSTFGGKYLPDCQKMVVPDGNILVLGDNRKASDDSRHDVGLVSVSDVDHVLPYSDQSQYRSLWRDASKDHLLADHPLLNTSQYINLLNQKRLEYHLAPLKHQPKLDISAQKRASIMLKYNDLSFEATKSGITMEKSIADAGYSNVTWGEAPTVGFYDAQELIDNFIQFQESREFLLNKDFQDTGISVQVGEVNGCPVQIVVQHLAGYVPPDYKPEVVQSWKKVLDQLKQVQPGWRLAKDYPQFYNLNQKEIDEIVSLIDQRIQHLEAIVSRMQANQWLTAEEKGWYEQDDELSKRLEQLTKQLNSL